MAKVNIKRYLTKNGIYLAFFLLLAILSILTPFFLRPNNLLNILRQASINGVVAVGMTFVIISGGIDLSVGSIMALSAVLAASLAHPGEHTLFMPLLAGLGAGCVCGFINGWMIAKKQLAPFIVTLGMMTIARGLAFVYTDGHPQINLSDSYNRIGGGYSLHIPNPIIIFLAVVIAGWFLLTYTRFGRQVYATGGNEMAARISGVITYKKIISVYTIAGLLAGLSGILLSSRIMSGAPSAASGYELDAIAATVIGGTSLKGGIGSISGTLIGVLIIGVMNNGLDLLAVSSYWQQIIKGVIILLAVYIDRKVQS